MICKVCGINIDTFQSKCSNCGIEVGISNEFHYIKEFTKHIPEQSSEVLENGDLVIVRNENHVWDGEIALVNDTKLGFCRIELNGCLLWVPEHWVNKYEPDDVDK